MVSKTTIGLTCDVNQTEMQLLAAIARTEHKLDADTGFPGSLRKEIGLKACKKATAMPISSRNLQIRKT